MQYNKSLFQCSSIIVIIFIYVQNVKSELYTSTVDMENILKIEEKLIIHLGAFIIKQQNNLNYLEKYFAG